MKRWLVKDSRGNSSFTHTLAVPVVILVTLKLIVSGSSITLPGGYVFTIASMTADDYKNILEYWLGLYGLRETTEKVLAYLGAKNASTVVTTGTTGG